MQWQMFQKAKTFQENLKDRTSLTLIVLAADKQYLKQHFSPHSCPLLRLQELASSQNWEPFMRSAFQRLEALFIEGLIKSNTSAANFKYYTFCHAAYAWGSQGRGGRLQCENPIRATQFSASGSLCPQGSRYDQLEFVTRGNPHRGTKRGKSMTECLAGFRLSRRVWKK